jgi:pyrrolidone-carboxylate peptidase
VRHSTLPMDNIVSAINAAGISGLAAVADTSGNPGTFLCGYLAYQEEWYQDLHSDPSDPYWCIAAGFTHVGQSVHPTLQAAPALQIELQTTIHYLDTVIPEPSTLILAAVGLAGVLAYAWRKRA